MATTDPHGRVLVLRAQLDRLRIGIGMLWELEARSSARVHVLGIRGANICSTDYVACLKSERNRKLVKAFFAMATS